MSANLDQVMPASPLLLRCQAKTKLEFYLMSFYSSPGLYACLYRLIPFLMLRLNKLLKHFKVEDWALSEKELLA